MSEETYFTVRVNGITKLMKARIINQLMKQHILMQRTIREMTHNETREIKLIMPKKKIKEKS